MTGMREEADIFYIESVARGGEFVTDGKVLHPKIPWLGLTR